MTNETKQIKPITWMVRNDIARESGYWLGEETRDEAGDGTVEEIMLLPLLTWPGRKVAFAELVRDYAVSENDFEENCTDEEVAAYYFMCRHAEKGSLVIDDLVVELV